MSKVAGPFKKLIRIRSLPWLPVMATALVLDHSYVPGGSDWNILGIVLWIGFIFLWLLRALPFTKKFVPAVPLPPWPVAILVVVSMLAISGVFHTIGFLLYRADFEKFTLDVKAKNLDMKRSFLERPKKPRAQIGPYPIYDFGVADDGGVYLVTSTGGFIDTEVEGFAYNPSLRSYYERGIWHEVSPLWGDWCTFYQREKF